MRSSIILLDLISGNVISDFASESEAWAALHDIAVEDGLDTLADLSLMLIQNGDPTVIAMEGALVRRVAREMERDSAARRDVSASA